MDKLFLFKIGGKVVDNPRSLETFLQGFAAISGPKILVHGGGMIAEQLARRLDVPTEMHEGRRVTSKAMRDVVTMVYGGQINKNLVASLQTLGCDALGLTGADGAIIRSKRRDPEPVDFGYVGDVTEVRADLLIRLLKLGLTPVLAPLSFDGEILNSNADSISSRVAEAMAPFYEVSMMYCFEQAGVMLDLKDPASLIATLNVRTYEKLLSEGVFNAGMLPKLEECFRACKKGVQKIYIGEAAACLAAAKGLSFQGTEIHI